MPAYKINLEADKNADSLLIAVSNMNRRLEKIHEGGGAKRMKNSMQRGKMSARRTD
jgi:acetyl-CoA carboxylase carboxyltransferase component